MSSQQQQKDYIPLPSTFASIPRHQLTFPFPSPIHKLDRVTEDLGGKIDVWAKRDDVHSGLAFGGNKTRKLEYLVPEAISQGCDTLVSVGGVQSNHTRQVAAVAAKLGMKCSLIQEDWVPKTTSPTDPTLYSQTGNRQLSLLLGATSYLNSSTFSIAHRSSLQSLTEELKSKGNKPYYIPAGASDHPLGGLGFARWAFEVIEQEKQMGVVFDTIVVCAVTGSTFAGIISGFLLAAQEYQIPPKKIIGIDASAKPKETFDQVLRIARFTGETIGLREKVEEKDVILDERFHAGIYGLPDEKTLEGMKYAAKMEGMITDPVYEGKSWTGMVELIKGGELNGSKNVLYAHLGGQSCLSAYKDIMPLE